MVISAYVSEQMNQPRMSTLGVHAVTLEKAISSSGDVKKV